MKTNRIFNGELVEEYEGRPMNGKNPVNVTSVDAHILEVLHFSGCPWAAPVIGAITKEYDVCDNSEYLRLETLDEMHLYLCNYYAENMNEELACANRVFAKLATSYTAKDCIKYIANAVKISNEFMEEERENFKHSDFTKEEMDEIRALIVIRYLSE